MVRAVKRLAHSTCTGRASSPAGHGKEEAIATHGFHGPNLRPGLEPCQEELSFRVPRHSLSIVLFLLTILALALPPGAVAQGLPELAPINPMSSSRSGLYFQP